MKKKKTQYIEKKKHNDKKKTQYDEEE